MGFDRKYMHVKQTVDGKQPHAKTLIAQTGKKTLSQGISGPDSGIPDLSKAGVRM